MAAFDLKSIQHQLPELLTPSSPNDLKEDEIFEAHIKEDSSAPPILPEPAPLPPRSNLNQKTKEDIFAALEEEERLLELKEKEEERAALLREKAKLDEKAKQEKAKEEEEKGKGKGKGKEKVRKSVTWSETSQVKEFVSHEILESPTTPRLSIEPAPPTDGSSSIIPSVPFSTLNRQLKGTYQEPLKPEPTPEPPKEKKEIMRTMVVERPMAPPRLPGAGGGAYKRSVFRDSNKGKGREVTEGLSSNSVVAPTPPAPSSPASPPQEKPPVKSTVVERSIVPPSLPVPKTNKPVFSGKPKPTPPPKDSLSASPAPTSSTPAEKPIVKATVVERTIAPPTLPSPNTAKKSVFSGKHKAPTEPASSTPIPISTSVAPGKPLNGSSNGTKPTVEDEEEEEEEEEDEEDDGSDGYIEFSDVGEDGEDYEMDMDDRMMMREATVDYYRLKNLIQGRGGMEGLMDPGDGLIPGEEFVPINATVTSDLSSSALAPESFSSTGASQSKFRSSVFGPSDTSSISLPTLVPGGGAKGALQNAIRVGKLENGKLIVGGVESEDEEEGADEVEVREGGYTEEEEENIAAGKEALMWGMIGGVVVRPEDL